MDPIEPTRKRKWRFIVVIVFTISASLAIFISGHTLLLSYLIVFETIVILEMFRYVYAQGIRIEMMANRLDEIGLVRITSQFTGYNFLYGKMPEELKKALT